MTTATNNHHASDLPDLGPGWEYVGDVAVDSGSVLLIDPCYARPSFEAISLSLAAAGQHAEVALSEHQLHTAVTCRTGIGDGIYPAFVRLAPCPFSSGRRVAELRVIFLEEE